MAIGDTVSGQIRVVRETVVGERDIVLGPLGSTEIDHKADPENSMYVNPKKGDRLPVGARSIRAKKAIFEAGEIIDVQHLSASLAELVTYNADEFFIGCGQEDMNRKSPRPRQLTVQDTTLTADPTSSITVWTSIFKYTIPDRQRFILTGPFNVAAVETA